MPSKEKSSFGILTEFEFLPKVTPFHFCGLQEILQEAKILRIHTGAAELVARRVGQKVAKWAKTRKTITTTELNTRVARELSTYDPDLAFLYQNRDKII